MTAAVATDAAAIAVGYEIAASAADMRHLASMTSQTNEESRRMSFVPGNWLEARGSAHLVLGAKCGTNRTRAIAPAVVPEALNTWYGVRRIQRFALYSVLRTRRDEMLWTRCLREPRAAAHGRTRHSDVAREPSKARPRRLW